ncbi:MAG: prephenate dehydrogenase/arogenate dehydrogenase family protein [Deltaproteobacteria bacterium]|nr:prephenate dehydrogenase/arogenate dehydrogenase family protein [Deltaproteobacteria bacterium]
MKHVTIGIIGGTGGIGRWFARFFEEQGFTVHVAGRKSGMDIPAMAKACSVVIVSVPIGATIGVIKKIGPYMKRNSLLMDLTSLKEEPVKAMLASSRSEVTGLHPLFGPSVRSLKNQNIVLCPARGKHWLTWLRAILEKKGAHIVETTPEDHDEMMAVVQGLTHLNTMTMGIMVRESGIDRAGLEKFSTPTFRKKLKLIDRVFSRPGLYAEIITGNPALRPLARRYAHIAAQLKKVTLQKDRDLLVALITGRRRP